MARGRKRKPAETREAEGNRGKREIPKTVKPAKGPRPPDPPKHMTTEARELWKLLARELWDLGLLTKIDEPAFAALCQAWGRWKAAEQLLAAVRRKNPSGKGLVAETSNGNVIQHPAVGIANRAMADVVKFAAEFGMTPSGRTRVPSHAPTVPKPAEANPESTDYYD